METVVVDENIDGDGDSGCIPKQRQWLWTKMDTVIETMVVDENRDGDDGYGRDDDGDCGKKTMTETMIA